MLLLFSLIALQGGCSYQPQSVSNSLAQKSAPNLPQPLNTPRFALVIGNANYQNAPQLDNTINDAVDMWKILTELGFQVALMRNANLKEMENAVRDFGMQLRSGSTNLFYFAGHGVQSENRNFLVPIGANIKSEVDIKYESLDANRILAQMEKANNGINIMILDACRDNPYPRRFKNLERGLARMGGPKGTLIAYATAPGNVANDGERNGIFTKHLVSALQMMPHLSVTDLFTEVTGKVVKETGGQQVPWQSVSLPKRFCFSKNSCSN